MKNIYKISLVLVMAIIFTACGNEGCPEGYSRIYNEKLVGYYNLHHDLPDGTPVFILTTPRGPEYVRGRENLQHSLDVYREEGLYGKEYETLGGDK